MRNDVNTHWTDRLSEYLDGDLPAEERPALEAHLAGCPACAATLDELRLVVAHARALPVEAPEIDLWPAIARQIEPRPGWRERLRAFLGERRFALTVPQLAAAAAVLVAVTGLLSWLAFQRPTPTTTPGNPPPSERIAQRTTQDEPDRATEPSRVPYAEEADAGLPAASSPARLASFDATQYDNAVAELERVLNEHRAQLDTATVRILEQNLAIIDRAVLDARKALEADPANPYLNGHLAQQMKAKIRLLQRAAGVVAAHG